MNKIFKYSVFIGLFLAFLSLNLIASPLNLDEIWSYGFCHNIYLGLVPYKDFNMVITPFYPFIISLFFHVFSSSILLFHILNSLVISFMFYLMVLLIGKKTFILLPLFIWPVNISFPNYNLFLLFLFILLVYLEQNKKNDILIGLLLGIFFLTKQSVGLLLSFSIIYYIKSKRQFFMRILGFLVPIFIFLIYLLITKSVMPFLDLCVFGLFDFGKGNGNLINVFSIFLVILVGILILKFRNGKNIYNIYLILFASITMPIFDYYHFILYLIAYIFIFLMDFNIEKIRLDIIGILLFMFFSIISFFKCDFDTLYPNDINHFEYRYLDRNHLYTINSATKLIKKYNNKVIIIGPDSYYYKIVMDQKIDYLDLINTGNWGYNGSFKLLNKVKGLDKDYVFFVNPNEQGMGKQTDQNLIKYIINNGELIEKSLIYDVYRLGGVE